MAKRDRVCTLIRAKVSEILRKRVNDQRIGFVTITEVKISSDFYKAWIYYSQIGSPEDRRKTRLALKSASGFIKGELGKQTRLQTVPQLKFVYDDSLERGCRTINQLGQLSDENQS